MMVACMVGSSIASRIMSRPDMKVERYMQGVFLISAGALAVPVFIKFFGLGEGVKGGPITFEGKIQMLGFLVFEAMVGIFWPSMMKMRSQYVPEEVRSTVMNFFRIPLNLFVCVILYNVALFPLSAMFAMCALFLVVAAFLQKKLEMLSSERPRPSTCLCRQGVMVQEEYAIDLFRLGLYSKELIRGQSYAYRRSGHGANASVGRSQVRSGGGNFIGRSIPGGIAPGGSGTAPRGQLLSAG